MTISTAPMWKAGVDWVTLNFFGAIEAFRVALLVYVLNPVRAFCENLPWLGVAVLLGLAGYKLAGLRLAALVVILTLFCAATGLWEKTMATVYLCGISAILAALIGIPIGVLCSRSDRLDRIVAPIIDTLQTLPSFCFIIPVVMLFRVGDVDGADRHGLLRRRRRRSATPITACDRSRRRLIEAATTAGCTRRQTFCRVQLPMALAGDHARHQPDDPARRSA